MCFGLHVTKTEWSINWCTFITKDTASAASVVQRQGSRTLQQQPLIKPATSVPPELKPVHLLMTLET